MTSSDKNQGYGAEELEPETPKVNPVPKPAAKANASASDDDLLSSDSLTEVKNMPGNLNFGGTGGTVTVVVDIPINDPALEDMQLYGSSTDSDPSNNEANLLVEESTRPSNGEIRAENEPCTPGSNYYVAIKFQYAGHERGAHPTVLNGYRDDTGAIVLS